MSGERCPIHKLAGCECAVMREPLPNYPIRQKSAQGQPPEKWDAARTCAVCKASFRGLAAGKTGERGLWDDRGGMRWYCSQECFDARGSR